MTQAANPTHETTPPDGQAVPGIAALAREAATEAIADPGAPGSTRLQAVARLHRKIKELGLRPPPLREIATAIDEAFTEQTVESDPDSLRRKYAKGPHGYSTWHPAVIEADINTLLDRLATAERERNEANHASATAPPATGDAA